ADAGGATLENSATGTAVPPGGSTITPPPSETTNPVKDPGFEFSKTVDPESGSALDPGSVVTYTLTGANTGETVLDPVDLTDDLSGVLAGASFNDDAAAQIDGEPVDAPAIDGDELTWSGALQPGQTVTVTYSVTVNADAGGATLENSATGTAVPPGGSTITPPPSLTTNPVSVPGYSLSKSVDPESGTAVDPGETVTYRITGVNTGETVLDPVDIVDDLSGVLAGASFNDDAVAQIEGEEVGGIARDGNTLSWSGALEPGQTVTLEYSVTVDADAGGVELVNSATGSAVPPGGSVITPPPSETTSPVKDPGFEFSKSVDPASGAAVDPGDIVTYTLTGSNTGETVLDPVDIVDDLSGVLSGASFNDDAVAQIDGEEVDAPALDGDELTWSGSLEPGQTVTVTYSVTVKAGAGGAKLVNSATGTAVPPGGSVITPPPSETTSPVKDPGFEFSKTVDPESGSVVETGDVITYTLTGANTGETVLDPVDISDDLSGVLADASFNDDAVAQIDGVPVGGLTIDGDELAWSGALPPGQTVTVVYSVTVKADASGATLTNVASAMGVGPGGEVIEPPAQETRNPVREGGGLSPSGMDQAPLIGGIAGAMLLVGASVVWLVSRRRRRA
ncbi:isopeptide-forming domain-containing fimbrial protein, partial [Microbacterium gubbeenense]